MALVQFTHVSISFGARQIIQDASLFLSETTRAALAGPNGAGKSTLMKIAAGMLSPDSGDCAITKGARISYLPQSPTVPEGNSVRQECEESFVHTTALLARQDEIGHKLLASTADDPETRRLLEEHEHIHKAVTASGYWNRDSEITRVLQGLGFALKDVDRQVTEFSSGWRMRVALAKVLLAKPDILLLDEPTNYLDLEARTWLIGFLNQFPGGILLVSHDRYFLDQAVNEVYELHNAKLTRYAGIFSAYEKRRAMELEALLDAWKRQQEEIERIELFIRRFRYKASKAVQVQSRVKMLEKLQRISIPEDMHTMHFAFPKAPHSGKIALRLENVAKSYGEDLVLDECNLVVEAGMRVALVGPNGSGKTTLLRIIAGVDSEYSGRLAHGAGIEIAYFSQDDTHLVSKTNTVWQEVENNCPTELIPKAKALLGAFLFRGDDIHKKVSVLSGGEASRLALLKILLHPANLLILDEPTNHLDLASKDILLEALTSFAGTILFVSHDRQFLEIVPDRILELKNGGTPTWYVGNYSYFLEKSGLAILPGTRILDSRGTSTPRSASPQSAPEISDQPSGGSVTYAVTKEASAHNGDQLGVSKSSAQGNAHISARAASPISQADLKVLRTQLRRLRKSEEELSAKVHLSEHRKKEVIEAMAMPENYVDGAKIKDLSMELSALEKAINEVTLQWEETVVRIEEMEGDIAMRTSPSPNRSF